MKIFNQVKIISLEKFRFFFAFDYKEIDNVDKSKKNFKCCLKSTNFQQIKNMIYFPEPPGPTKEIKLRSLVNTDLFKALGKVKYNRLYLIR